MANLKDKKVYAYCDGTGEYIGTSIARVCPVTKADYIYPACTTETPPPADVAGMATVYRNGEWVHIEDNRGKHVYNLETGERGNVINFLNEDIPEGYTLTPPPEPEPLTESELRRIAIMAELADIDMRSIRPMRANPQTQDDIDMLLLLESNALELRNELSNLE